MMHVRKAFPGIVLCALLLHGCASRPLYRNTQLMMGTFVEVTSPDPTAAAIVFDEMRRIEKLMSKYDAGSEISQLNARGTAVVGEETFFIITEAIEFWRLSEGAFDITVGPLLDLWGFTDNKPRLPSGCEEWKAALTKVGSDKILLDEASHRVTLTVPGMRIDLGGIAKGYALDASVKKLKERGINSCLINLGGQVYCVGDNAGRSWKVAIRDPRTRRATGAYPLADMSVSTSGNYEQFFDIDYDVTPDDRSVCVGQCWDKRGGRYGHLIDPRTGCPAHPDYSSVTVIAKEGMTADALSTSIFILGRKRGEALASRFPGVRVIYQ